MKYPLNSSHSRVLLLIFFISGFISLVYQIVWQKVLSQMIGVDTYSITLIVSIFMLGLGLGAIAGAAFTRFSINLLWIYSAVELLLGIIGVFSVPVLVRSNTLLHQYNVGYLMDFLLNFSLLLLPTMLMGMTLPIVLHLFRKINSVGTVVGVVYSANILGAAFGTISAGFFLIGIVGLTNTARLMAVLNIALGVGVWWYLRSRPDFDSEESPLLSDPATYNRGPLPHSRSLTVILIVLSVASGFIALSYEIIFFRIFTTYFGATSYVFPILIASYLIMMTLGNHFFGRRADRTDALALLIPASAIAVISTLLILEGQALLFRFGLRTDYLLLWHLRTWLPFAQIPLIFIISLVLMIPVACISGFFPVIVRWATTHPSRLGMTVGYVYFTQTIGNFLGAIVAGLVLLPTIGTSDSLRLMGMFLLVLPLLLLIPSYSNRTIQIAPRQRFLMLAAVIAIGFYPTEFYSSVRRHESSGATVKPVVIKEGALGATLGYPSVDGRSTEVFVGRMFSNSIYTASPKNIDCFPWYPIAVIEQMRPKRGLYIGLGTGAGPLCMKALFPEISVDIVEINPELIEIMQEHGAPEIQALLQSSRLSIADGRRFVQQHLSDRYDIIQMGVFNAWCSGCGNLFTEEFLRTLSTILNSGGIVTYNAYPPAVKAGLEVFDHLALFSPGEKAISHVVARKQEPIVLVSPPPTFLTDLGKAGLIRADSESLQEGCMITQKETASRVAAISKSTDDRPTTEYFLTNNQFTYPFDWWQSYRPPRDMRVFICNETTIPFEPIFYNTVPTTSERLRAVAALR
ncbi:MAG: fused MFS/spermidine synthase [Candidatus Manganitrophus sp. SA1]|nr:fused MFS/spermidine synthase [Candidatus Manganitrophus morganii]